MGRQMKAERERRAVILEAVEGEGTSDDRGVLATDLNSDGNLRELLYVDGGVSRTGTVGFLRMQGNLVFRHAVEKLADTAHRVLDKAGVRSRRELIARNYFDQYAQRLNDPLLPSGSFAAAGPADSSASVTAEIAQ